MKQDKDKIEFELKVRMRQHVELKREASRARSEHLAAVQSWDEFKKFKYSRQGDQPRKVALWAKIESLVPARIL